MKKQDKTIYTFTKRWVNRLMWFFVIWVTLSYILAFLGKTDIAETLSESVVTSGIVIFSGYMLKAFFETYSEENMKFKKQILDKDHREDPEI